MRTINVDELSVEYIVKLTNKNTNEIYTEKVFCGLDEVNEGAIIQKIITYYEKVYRNCVITQIIADCSVPCGISYNPKYCEIYPNLSFKVIE